MSVDTLLNFNGVDGSQVFTDDGLSPVVWTPSGVNPVLSTTEKKFGSSSLRFTGSGSIGGSVTLSSVFTIECWVNFDNLVGVQMIFDFENGSGSNLLSVNTNIEKLSLWDNVSAVGTSFDLAIGSFQHIAMTYDNGVIELFVDGARHLNTSYTGTPPSNLNLGETSGGIQGLTGYMDGFRVTDGEILYNFISPISGAPTTELTTTTVPPPVLPTDHELLPQLSNTDTPIVIPTVKSDHKSLSGGGITVEPTPDPTSTNIISGNVKKLGLPFGARIAIVNTGLNPEVVGSGLSDDITGDYSIDVYPETGDCLIYVAPDYGSEFTPDTFVGVDQIIHPTVPNRYIYICTVAGDTGGSEPIWSTEGLINSGTATFNTLPLHRPLMNGFIKPVVTPI